MPASTRNKRRTTSTSTTMNSKRVRHSRDAEEDITAASELDVLAAVATSVHQQHQEEFNENDTFFATKRSKRETKSKSSSRGASKRVKEDFEDYFEEPLSVSPESSYQSSFHARPMEMTQGLLDSLMLPAKVRWSHETGETFIKIPNDYVDEPDYVQAIFVDNKILKFNENGEEYWLTSTGDGFVEYCREHDVKFSLNKNRERSRSFLCSENFVEINGELNAQAWLEDLSGQRLTSSLVQEHDYFQPFIKYGPSSATDIVDVAIAAYNKYKNFISLSRPSGSAPNYLFGLFFEKEDPCADFWLLPKPVDQVNNTYDGLPENHWSGNVVVAREELVVGEDEDSLLVPFVDLLDTPTDTRRRELQISWEDTKKYINQQYDEEHRNAVSSLRNQKFSKAESKTKKVNVAPIRILQKASDGSTKYVRAFIVRNTEEALTMAAPLDLDEDEQAASSVKSKQPRTPESSDAKSAKLSREKVEEMDFAMRCIKEIQHHRYRGYYPLRCKICNREFTAPTSLVVHYRSHAGIKPFTCSVCLASFTRRHSLKYHMLCHNGESRFRCEICSRLFRHSGHFRDHMRKHELGTPFACDICGSEFGTRTSYRRHMTLSHEAVGPTKARQKNDRNFRKESGPGAVVVDEMNFAIDMIGY